MFGSALLKREGVRGFGFGIGCLGVIQITRDGRRQVGIGRIGVGTVMVVTRSRMDWYSAASQVGNVARVLLDLAVSGGGSNVVPLHTGSWMPLRVPHGYR